MNYKFQVNNLNFLTQNQSHITAEYIKEQKSYFIKSKREAFLYFHFSKFILCLEENSNKKFWTNIPAHKPRNNIHIETLGCMNRSALCIVSDVRQIAVMHRCKTDLCKIAIAIPRSKRYLIKHPSLGTKGCLRLWHVIEI